MPQLQRHRALAPAAVAPRPGAPAPAAAEPTSPAPRHRIGELSIMPARRLLATTPAQLKPGDGDEEEKAPPTPRRSSRLADLQGQDGVGDGEESPAATSLHDDGDESGDEAEEKEASHLPRRSSRLAEKARPDRGKAEEMLARAYARGMLRITGAEDPDSRKDLIKRGFYTTPSGPVTVGFGGQSRQMMAQTNREYYNGATLGPYPAYSSVKEHLPDVRALYDAEWKPPKDTPPLGRAAASAGAAMVNVSEPYFAPASDKLVRSLAKRHAGNPKAPHPLDEAVNPAVGTDGHQRMAKLMSGETALNEDQRAAIEEWSDSSAAEDDPFATRSGMLKTDPTRSAKKPNNSSNNFMRGKKRRREDNDKRNNRNRKNFPNNNTENIDESLDSD